MIANVKWEVRDEKILLVVDMQNDFIDGPLGTPEARAIVDNVCAKIREGEWDEVLVTKDLHYENTYFDSQEGQKLPILHCVNGSIGSELNLSVMVSLCKVKNVKFFGKNSFGCKRLIRHIEDYYDFFAYEFELTLIGVCTDICVISNALLLKAHYPEMKIVVDAACCAGSTPEKHRMALEVMKSCQVEVENMPEDLPDNYIVRNFVEKDSNPYNCGHDKCIHTYCGWHPNHDPNAKIPDKYGCWTQTDKDCTHCHRWLDR